MGRLRPERFSQMMRSWQITGSIGFWTQPCVSPESSLALWWHTLLPLIKFLQMVHFIYPHSGFRRWYFYFYSLDRETKDTKRLLLKCHMQSKKSESWAVVFDIHSRPLPTLPPALSDLQDIDVTTVSSPVAQRPAAPPCHRGRGRDLRGASAGQEPMNGGCGRDSEMMGSEPLSKPLQLSLCYMATHPPACISVTLMPGVSALMSCAHIDRGTASQSTSACPRTMSPWVTRLRGSWRPWGPQEL